MAGLEIRNIWQPKLSTCSTTSSLELSAVAKKPHPCSISWLWKATVNITFKVLLSILHGSALLRTLQDQVLSTKDMSLPQRDRGHKIRDKYGRQDEREWEGNKVKGEGYLFPSGGHRPVSGYRGDRHGKRPFVKGKGETPNRMMCLILIGHVN